MRDVRLQLPQAALGTSSVVMPYPARRGRDLIQLQNVERAGRADRGRAGEGLKGKPLNVGNEAIFERILFHWLTKVNNIFIVNDLIKTSDIILCYRCYYLLKKTIHKTNLQRRASTYEKHIYMIIARLTGSI